MPPPPSTDYYEALQLSPRADHETIERVFRLLAKRYHPDNRESGNTERFTELVEAYRVLSDPEKRAGYDANYQDARESRWRIFDQDSVASEVAIDLRIRSAILSILYTARRNNSREPGVGVLELERLTACPQEVINFQAWYLRENGWIARTETGTFAITAPGIDRLFELGGPSRLPSNLLTEGNGAPAPESAPSIDGAPE